MHVGSPARTYTNKTKKPSNFMVRMYVRMYACVRNYNKMLSKENKKETNVFLFHFIERHMMWQKQTYIYICIYAHS